MNKLHSYYKVKPIKNIFFLLILVIISETAFANSLKDYMPIRLMHIPQNGMAPSYKENTFILLKSGPLYSPNDIQRGSVVTFYKSIKDIQYIYIWRVIALPGDTIETDKNTVSLNGKLLKRQVFEPEKNKDIFTEYINDQSYQIYLEGDGAMHKLVNHTIPDGYVFVMGDNRNHAGDSRYMGLIPINSIFGITF